MICKKNKTTCLGYKNGECISIENCSHKAEWHHKLQGLYFGAKLVYRSPVNGLLMNCLYIREEDGMALVAFQDGYDFSKVDFVQLGWNE